MKRKLNIEDGLCNPLESGQLAAFVRSLTTPVPGGTALAPDGTAVVPDVTTLAPGGTAVVPDVTALAPGGTALVQLAI